MTMKVSQFMLLVAYGLTTLSQQIVHAQNLCDVASLERSSTTSRSSVSQDTVTFMEEECQKMYSDYDMRLEDLRLKIDKERIEYAYLKEKMTIKFKEEFDELVRKRDNDLADLEAEAKEDNWSDTKKNAEFAEFQDEWSGKFDDFFEDEESQIETEKTSYTSQLEGRLADLDALKNDWGYDIGYMPKITLEGVAPTAFHITENQEETARDIEEKMNEVMLMFSGGICCDFDETNGMMTEEESAEYVKGVERCFVFAMRQNGLTCNINNITLVSQEPTHTNAFESVTAATTTAGGNGRRLGGSSCRLCIGGYCHFGCPSNNYKNKGSGWRRELNESNLRGSQGFPQTHVDDSLPQSGRGLNAGKNVKDSLEHCILPYVKKKIDTVFGDTEEAECRSCSFDDCGLSSVSVERFDWV